MGSHLSSVPRTTPFPRAAVVHRKGHPAEPPARSSPSDPISQETAGSTGALTAATPRWAAAACAFNNPTDEWERAASGAEQSPTELISKALAGGSGSDDKPPCRGGETAGRNPSDPCQGPDLLAPPPKKCLAKRHLPDNRFSYAKFVPPWTAALQ